MNFRAFRKFTPTAFISLMLVAASGCHRVSSVSTTYFAIVERIGEKDGDHYSPMRGWKPLLQVRLRLAGGPTRDSILTILALDLYSAQLYGEEGDMVSFIFPGILPASGEIWFDHLRSFKVVKKKGANKAPEPTTMAVTPRAIARISEMKLQNPNRHAARGAPATVVAHL